MVFDGKRKLLAILHRLAERIRLEDLPPRNINIGVVAVYQTQHLPGVLLNAKGISPRNNQFAILNPDSLLSSAENNRRLAWWNRCQDSGSCIAQSTT